MRLTQWDTEMLHNLKMEHHVHRNRTQSSCHTHFFKKKKKKMPSNKKGNNRIIAQELGVGIWQRKTRYLLQFKEWVRNSNSTCMILDKYSETMNGVASVVVLMDVKSSSKKSEAGIGTNIRRVWEENPTKQSHAVFRQQRGCAVWEKETLANSAARSINKNDQLY